MADLDSFFAKKDKKKKKGKEKKFATTSSSSMAKTLEATETQPSNTEKEVKVDAPVGAGPSSQNKEDEWREQEEQTQDLEGLKVQSLRLDSEERPQQRSDKREQGNPDEDEDVDGSEEMSSAAMSAWQKKSSSTPPPMVAAELSEPVAVDTKPGGTGVYVPPSRRQGGSGPGGRRPHNVAPDIQNASAFPSLQASLQSQPTGKDKAIDKDFKEVKSTKGSRAADSQYEAPSLELTNKYSALRSN